MFMNFEFVKICSHTMHNNMLASYAGFSVKNLIFATESFHNVNIVGSIKMVTFHPMYKWLCVQACSMHSLTTINGNESGGRAQRCDQSVAKSKYVVACRVQDMLKEYISINLLVLKVTRVN